MKRSSSFVVVVMLVAFAACEDSETPTEPENPSPPAAGPASLSATVMVNQATAPAGIVSGGSNWNGNLSGSIQIQNAGSGAGDVTDINVMYFDSAGNGVDNPINVSLDPMPLFPLAVNPGGSTTVFFNQNLELPTVNGQRPTGEGTVDVTITYSDSTGTGNTEVVPPLVFAMNRLNYGSSIVCQNTDTTHCVVNTTIVGSDGRFRITGTSSSNPMQTVEVFPDGAFFDTPAGDLLVQVEDRCFLDNSYGVNVFPPNNLQTNFEIQVLDTEKNIEVTYVHSNGNAAQPIFDPMAFPVCDSMLPNPEPVP